MKKILLALLLSCGVSMQAYNGQCCPQTYCDECCCADWSVYADWLYWRARRCDLGYAIPYDNSSSAFIGDVDALDPTYESGFRVGFLYNCDRLFFDAFYTHYRARESETATGTLAPLNVVSGFSPIFPVSEARAKWDLDYDVVDLLMGYELCSRRCWHSYLFGGLKLAFIDQEFDSFYTFTNVVDRTLQDLDMDAYGVDLGIGARYNLCGCFELFGRFSYDVMLGNFKRKFSYGQSNDSGQTFNDIVDIHDDCWGMVNCVNLAFGLGYNYLFSGCWCANLGLAIGYEFHQWIGLLDFLNYTNINSTDSTISGNQKNLGLDGLFVRVSLGF